MVKFPSKLEELLPPAAVTKVLDLLSQPALTGAVRETLQKVGIKDANPVGQVQEAWRQARGWFESVVDRVMDQNHASPAAINATGSLFDARWSSLPMDSVVLQALVAAAVNFQDQGQLEQYASRIAAEATGASSAIIVTSPTACLALLASAPTFRGGLVIARTDVVRIPGSVDVRATLAAGTNSFTDVGAVNGTTAEDWQAVLKSDTQTLLLVSPNSLDTREARDQRLLAIARAKAVRARVVELLIDATQDAALAEHVGFPLLKDAIATGADLVMAPLDNLLGGAGGAIIAGRDELISALRTSAQHGGTLAHGPLLASAAAALRTSEPADQSRSNISQMLLTNIDNLKERARRLAIQLNDTPRIATAEAVARQTRLGPSPWQRYQAQSHAVVLKPRESSADELAKELASGKLGTSIWARVEDSSLVLDLRFVEPADDHKLVEALSPKATAM